MDKKEREIRSVSLKLFITVEPNRDTTIDMVKQGGSSLYHITEECGYKNWDKIMQAWELIAKFRNDNPYADEVEDGQILVDEMSMGGKGATIKAFQSKNGKWVNKENEPNWYGITWTGYNVFVDGMPHVSNSNSLKEAVWKTVTDFTMFWCTENISEFNSLITNEKV